MGAIRKVFGWVVCMLGCWLASVAFGQNPPEYTRGQQIKDMLRLLSRHEQLVRINLEHNRSPSELFQRSAELLQILGPNGAAPIVKDAVVVISSYYSSADASGVKRWITLEEEASPVFGTLRGNWGNVCSPQKSPFFTLLRHTRTFKVYLSQETHNRPDAYVFLAEVARGDRVVPYVLVLNGEDISANDVRHIMAQIAVFYETDRLLIPEFGRLAYLLNYGPIQHGFASFEKTPTMIKLPPGWGVVAGDAWTENNYFSPEELRQGFEIVVPEQELSSVKAQNPVGVLKDPYPPHTTIKAKTAFQRALIAAGVGQLDVRYLTDVVPHLRVSEDEPFDRYLDVAWDLLDTGRRWTYGYHEKGLEDNPLTLATFLKVQNTFPKPGGEKMSLREVLDILPPYTAAISFNEIRKTQEGRRIMPQGKWRRLAATLYARLRRHNNEFERQRLQFALYDLLPRRMRWEVLSRGVLEGGDDPEKLKMFRTDIETAFQVTKPPTEESLLAKLAVTFVSLYTYDGAPKRTRYRVLKRALEMAPATRVAINVGLVFQKYPNHLSKTQWREVVGTIFEQVRFDHDWIFRGEWDHRSPVGSVLLVHAMLPSSIKQTAFNALLRFCECEGAWQKAAGYVHRVYDTDPAFVLDRLEQILSHPKLLSEQSREELLRKIVQSGELARQRLKTLSSDLIREMGCL